MTGVARVATDSAGGVIVGVLAPTVYVNGVHVAVLNSAVAGHGTGAHAAPVMAACSATVFAGGIGVCRAGDAASCGDVASGSSNVFAN